MPYPNCPPGVSESGLHFGPLAQPCPHERGAAGGCVKRLHFQQGQPPMHIEQVPPCQPMGSDWSGPRAPALSLTFLLTRQPRQAIPPCSQMLRGRDREKPV